MDLTHIHLFMNHLPIWGSIFTFLFILYSFYKKNTDYLKIFLWLFVFIAIITIPVFLTGDPAGETIKNLPGINESVIDSHEDAAWISLILIEVTGAFILLGIFLIRKRGVAAAWFKYSLTILMIACIVSFTWTANLGGEIRHTEIRTDSHIEKPEK